MDLNILISSLYDLDGNHNDQLELLQDIISNIKETKQVLLSNPDKLFVLAKYLLGQWSHEKLIEYLCEFVSTLVEFTGSELELYFVKLLPELLNIIVLGNKTLIQKIIYILCQIIKKIHNSEQIINALMAHGLSNNSPYMREQVLKMTPTILDCDPGIFYRQTGYTVARKLIENIIVCTKDKAEVVQKSAGKIIYVINEKKYEYFEQAFKRLAKEHQMGFKKVLEDQRMKKITKKFIQMNEEIDNEQTITKLIKQFLTEKIELPALTTNLLDYRSKLELVLQNFSCDMQSGLYFGVVEGDLLLDCLDLRDKKQQQFASQALLECLKNVKNYDPLTPYLQQLLNFLNLILIQQSEDYSQQLYLQENILDILLHLFTNLPPGANSSNLWLPSLFPGIVNKLNDQRVQIRKKAMEVMQKVVENMNQIIVWKNLLFFLGNLVEILGEGKKDDGKSFWHAKEELFKLLSIILLQTLPINQNPLLYNPNIS